MKKSIYWSILILAVVVIAVGVVWSIVQTPQLAPSNHNQVSQSSAQNQPTSAGAAKTNHISASTIANGSAGTISYATALVTYKDRRIQLGFDQHNYCIVAPYAPIYRNGTTVMLDNRTNTSLKVSLDQQSYVISPYGFKIVTLTVGKLPHTIMVSCGGGVNNGTITLE